MFFFGIASNIITIGILGIFSLIFFYQGIQTKYFSKNTEDKIFEFEEKTKTTEAYYFNDIQPIEANIETIDKPYTPPYPNKNYCYGICQCSRWKNINQPLWSHRGPPAA